MSRSDILEVLAEAEATTRDEILRAGAEAEQLLSSTLAKTLLERLKEAALPKRRLSYNENTHLTLLAEHEYVRGVLDFFASLERIKQKRDELLKGKSLGIEGGPRLPEDL